jgi:hypothetical protein
MQKDEMYKNNFGVVYDKYTIPNPNCTQPFLVRAAIRYTPEKYTIPNPNCTQPFLVRALVQLVTYKRSLKRVQMPCEL